MKRPLNRRGERLYLEDVPVARLVEEFGTPLYAYGRTALRERAERFDAAFGDSSHLVTYAIKANTMKPTARSWRSWRRAIRPLR